MLIRFAAIVLATMSATALADAGHGEFMGYSLGGRYPPGAAARQQVTTTGNLIVIAAQPVKPADIAEVSLLTTPETLTIGHIAASQWFPTEEAARDFARQYFRLLRARYPDWPFGGEVMDARMHLVEVSFDKPPYNLRLHLAPAIHDGKDMWRFSMTLGWSPDSPQARTWSKLSADEQVAAKKGADQTLLRQSDLRGL